MRRYLPVVLLLIAGLAGAPFLGKVRDALLDAFPRSFVAVLAASLGGVFLGLLGYGVWQIRSHRRLRYGALALVVALVALQTFVVNRGNPTVDIVEKVHFVQFGLLAFLLYRAQRRQRDPSLLIVPVLGALLGGTLEEAVQWWVQVRVGDINDVALNAYAGLCGLMVGLALLPPKSFSWFMSRRRWRQLGAFAALVVALVGAFYQAAHLGHEVHDPAIGTFRSWSTAEGLLELSADRALRWSKKQPDFKSPFGAEDRYATEAGWHVGHRNVSREEGRVLPAWRENQILEKYFDPFLDLPAAGTSAGHRLSPEELGRLKEALPPRFHQQGLAQVDVSQDYVSPVLMRIDTSLSPAQLWLLVALAMALCLVGAEVVARFRGSVKAGRDGSPGGI